MPWKKSTPMSERSEFVSFASREEANVSALCRRYGISRKTGYDFSEEGVATGRAEAETLGLTNARFEAKDVAELDGAEEFDLITAFDAIHDQAKPAQVL